MPSKTPKLLLQQNSVQLSSPPLPRSMAGKDLVKCVRLMVSGEGCIKALELTIAINPLSNPHKICISESYDAVCLINSATKRFLIGTFMGRKVVADVPTCSLNFFSCRHTHFQTRNKVRRGRFYFTDLAKNYSRRRNFESYP